jgi:hypothetical protein
MATRMRSGGPRDRDADEKVPTSCCSKALKEVPKSRTVEAKKNFF